MNGSDKKLKCFKRQLTLTNKLNWYFDIWFDIQVLSRCITFHSTEQEKGDLIRRHFRISL
ncbi:hypothetical protein TUM4249_28160 [Shewanella sp. KT0246]|nr:hypothetical protein TUM4249_28160 [Shewanella sp. KT0246]